MAPDSSKIAFDKLPPNWEAMNWQEFFEIFDRTAQSFLYDDTPGSRICKLTRGPRPGPWAAGIVFEETAGSKENESGNQISK